MPLKAANNDSCNQQRQAHLPGPAPVGAPTPPSPAGHITGKAYLMGIFKRFKTTYIDSWYPYVLPSLRQQRYYHLRRSGSIRLTGIHLPHLSSLLPLTITYTYRQSAGKAHRRHLPQKWLSAWYSLLHYAQKPTARYPLFPGKSQTRGGRTAGLPRTDRLRKEER